MKEIFQKAQNKTKRETAAKDANRLHYHLMPPVGWLNDPNGLCQYKGVYHIFYQYSPMDASGKQRKGWGHYSTPDFVHYTEEPVALYPDCPLDEGGAYSGSAFVHDDTLHLFYTGNRKMEGDFDYINAGRQHWTCHSSSQDGKTFSFKEVLLTNEDYPADFSCHVRDPKIYQRDGRFYMVLGARTRDSQGEILLYESQNLKDWNLYGTIQGENDFGYMWECPDLFELDGQLLLLLCPQGIRQDGILYENLYQNGYFRLDGPWSADMKADGFTELDHGFDFYAPQSFLDERGRRILIGWMGMPDVDYHNEQTVVFGWQHCLSLPRELRYKNGQIFQYPVEEILNLKKQEQPIMAASHQKIDLPGPCFMAELEISQPEFTIRIRKDVLLRYENNILSLDMGQSGSGRTIRHIQIDHIDTISIFSDTSSLEIFINGGQESFTTRVYDDKTDLSISANVVLKGSIAQMGSFEVQYDQGLMAKEK